MLVGLFPQYPCGSCGANAMPAFCSSFEYDDAFAFHKYAIYHCDTI